MKNLMGRIRASVGVLSPMVMASLLLLVSAAITLTMALFVIGVGAVVMTIMSLMFTLTGAIVTAVLSLREAWAPTEDIGRKPGLTDAELMRRANAPKNINQKPVSQPYQEPQVATNKREKQFYDSFKPPKGVISDR